MRAAKSNSRSASDERAREERTDEFYISTEGGGVFKDAIKQTALK